MAFPKSAQSQTFVVVKHSESRCGLSTYRSLRRGVRPDGSAGNNSARTMRLAVRYMYGTIAFVVVVALEFAFLRTLYGRGVSSSRSGPLKDRLPYRLYPLNKCTTATAIRLVTGNPSASSESITKNTP
jgi:hypothetical protein